MLPHGAKYIMDDNLAALVEARRKLAVERERILKGEEDPARSPQPGTLDRQIAELDGEMARLILHRAYPQ